MSKAIQVRGLPDRLHRELVRRAKAKRMSLTRYVEALLEREVTRPPAEEVFERIARRTPVDLGRSVAEILREEREGRPAP
jgi:hypothetical protein